MSNTKNNTAPSIFTFAEKRDIRVSSDATGESWFCANEVCEILGHSNPRQAISTHVEDDDVQKLDIIDTLGRTQEMNFINEAGVYALIFGSTLPEAKAFKRWVTHEVLPQLRKVGFYGQPELKERIALGYQMIAIVDRLGKAKDAFVRMALIGRLREVCMLLGQAMPDIASIGKDADQLAIPGV